MRRLKCVFIVVTLLCLSGCFAFSADKYINKKINLDINGCDININKDERMGFNGDGIRYVKASCTKNSKNMIKQVNNWNKLPLSQNLELIMYGGEKDNVEYDYDLAKNQNIPKIENGYYLFIDRHKSSTDTSSDKDLFDRTSFNFTLAMYDIDSNTLYFYEFDT